MSGESYLADGQREAIGMLKEFREFISRGNVIDLAVGIIIGASFTAIVTALVEKVIMPPIGLITGGIDFNRLEIVLRPENPATEAIEKVSIQYGAFLNACITFLIVAFVVFLLVKMVNKLRRTEAASPEAPAAPTPTEALLAEIRDELRGRPVRADS